MRRDSIDFISSKVMDRCWFSLVVVANLFEDVGATDLGARKADAADSTPAADSNLSNGSRLCCLDMIVLMVLSS